jgi:hypothetical protein
MCHLIPWGFQSSSARYVILKGKKNFVIFTGIYVNLNPFQYENAKISIQLDQHYWSNPCH